MDFILALYRVEHELEADGQLGTEEHLARRRAHSGPVLKSFRRWLTKLQPNHAPKTPLGRAIRYTLKQWTPLSRFLDDVRVPLDNNRSEARVRRVARGRNYSERVIMRSRAVVELPAPMSCTREPLAVAA